VTRSFILALACFTAAMYAQQAPEIPFESVPNFLKLPANLYLGEASGVAVNSKHHVFVFSRGNSTGPAYGATAAQILEFAPDGTYIREIGHNLYAWSFAHAIRFDKDDNLWAVDKGSDMIIEFDPAGRVKMVFGRKKEASDEGDEPWKRVPPGGRHLPAVNGQFRQPTDVTWDPAGDIFISDGYINSRVAKFDKNGDWVKQWGEFGSGDGEFNTPHSIASDAQGNIYVADRGNRRIQVFDSGGNFLRAIAIDIPPPPVVHMWMGTPPAPQPPSTVGAPAANGTMQPGAPWAVCISPGPTQYLFAADAYPGRIYKMTLDGKVVGYFGSMGHQLKQFGWVHEIACPSENEIYTAEILNWRVQKLILNPAAHHTSSTRATKTTATK